MVSRNCDATVKAISVVSLKYLSKPMKTLYVNGRFLTQNVTGVQRYAIEMCKKLATMFDDFHIAVPKSTKTHEDKLKPFLFEVGQLSGTIWEQVDLCRFMKNNGSVLLNLCNTAPLGYHRNVVTIHDLGVFRNSDWYEWKFANWYKFLTPRIVKKAISILTVSEFSKREMIDVLGIDAQNIHVVYNGVGEDLRSASVQQKEKIVLHVGTLSERKNVKMIVDCYLQSCPNNFKLVLCGKADKNLSIPATEFNKINSIEVINGLNDTQLSALMAKASYLISASNYEGFGLPVLEGLANDAKPILSDIPVYRELFSGVAEFFSLERPEELVKIFQGLDANDSKLESSVESDFLERFKFGRSADKIKTIIQFL